MKKIYNKNLTFRFFLVFFVICITFNIYSLNIYAQNKPQDLKSTFVLKQTTPNVIIITSIINAIAVVMGASGTLFFARKSARIEAKEFKLRVTPVLEIKPMGGARSGLTEFGKGVKITNKGQLQTIIKNQAYPHHSTKNDIRAFQAIPCGCLNSADQFCHNP